MRRRELMSSVNGGGGVSHWWDNYMTIAALEDGLTVTLTEMHTDYKLEYSLDGATWTRLLSGKYTPEINTRDVIAFRGDGLSYAPTYQGLGTFNINKKCNLLGNCMSLLYVDDAAIYDSVPNYAFNKLFNTCSTIISVSDNFLPAGTVNDWGYQNMFNSCTSMIKGPNLPATTIGNYCYRSMFYYCSALTAASELPAEAVAVYCYYSMYEGCHSLVTAPSILPAPSLASYCYGRMFSECVVLKKAPTLPAKTLVSFCYYYMFYECSKLNYIKALFTTTPSGLFTSSWVRDAGYNGGTFVKSKDATWDVTGENGVPSGWTVKTE